jgi:hypothetical protein
MTKEPTRCLGDAVTFHNQRPATVIRWSYYGGSHRPWVLILKWSNLGWFGGPPVLGKLHRSAMVQTWYMDVSGLWSSIPLFGNPSIVGKYKSLRKLMTILQFGAWATSFDLDHGACSKCNYYIWQGECLRTPFIYHSLIRLSDNNIVNECKQCYFFSKIWS